MQTTAPPSERSRRGQAQVLGFVIIFALAMTALTLYQVNVIPARNEAVEFDHTQTVANDLSTLQDRLRSASISGSPRSASVQLGLRYPSRTLGINAPPPQGRIRTTGTREVVIENARASGQAGDYWDGSRKEFETRHLVYSPAYNYRSQDPTFRLETGLLARQVGDGTVVESASGPVAGQRIDLLTVAGDYREVGRSKSIDLVPVSGASEYRVVTDDGDPITLTIPTELPASAWRKVVEDEPHVTNMDHRGSEVEITLQQGQNYRLRVLRAGVESGGDPSARYLTAERTARSVPEDGRESLTVTARDRYGNPVGGVTVDATVVGDGSVSPPSATTDEDGKARFVYSPGTTGTDAEVLTELSGVASVGPEHRVRFDIAVGSDSGSSGDDGTVNSAGVGGRSSFADSKSIEVAQPEGLWEGVNTFDQVLLSNGDPRFADPTTETRETKLTFYAKDPDRKGNRKFSVILKPANDGVSWQSKKVKITNTFTSKTYVNDAKLTREAANKIMQRNGRSGQVDLLDNANYLSNPISPTEKQELQNIASDNTYVYTQNVKGGVVELTIK